VFFLGLVTNIKSIITLCSLHTFIFKPGIKILILIKILEQFLNLCKYELKIYVMKHLINIIAIVIILTTFGCTGDEGPQGPVGPQGPEGPQGPAGESGYVFEFEDINFASPDYDVFLTYPSGFEGLASDVALVYLLWGVENVDGEDLEVWRQLSQTVIDERGTLVYNYDFTKNDVRLFLEATYSLDTLEPIDTDNWIARVVVVPGDFWASSRLQGLIEYNVLIEALNLTDLPTHEDVKERRAF